MSLIKKEKSFEDKPTVKFISILLKDQIYFSVNCAC